MQFECSLGDGGGAKSLLLKKKQHTKWTNKMMQWLKRHSCAGWQTVKWGVKEKEKKELMESINQPKWVSFCLKNILWS
jgi:hypothetical protein